jgi:hypothetical protein
MTVELNKDDFMKAFVNEHLLSNGFFLSLEKTPLEHF